MQWLGWLEKRLGAYALPNATLWLAVAQGFVYLADAGDRLGAAPIDLAGRLSLVPAEVLRGEVWRVVTFPLVPPPAPPLFLLLYLWAFYYFGSAVEAVWGTFRYNAYLALGFLFTAAAAFAEPELATDGGHVKNSVFLAFAALFPDYVIRLYFVLPVRAWLLAALSWAFYAVGFWQGGLSTRLMIAAAVGNFFLFFGAKAWGGLKQSKRRRDFQRRVEVGQRAVQHECRVCGLTSAMAPRTPFRYCGQCAGQRCYCPDHLRSHEHVTADSAR